MPHPLPPASRRCFWWAPHRRRRCCPAVACAAGGFFALAGLAEDDGRAAVVLTPALFAVLILFLWEVLTRGFDVPMILLPPPSTIGAAFWEMLPELLQDVQQTVLYAAIPGFLIGTALGFLAGAAVDRSPFLQQGLLPLSNFASVIPIVGVAPIMIMWFGFGWQSKAAVVILITFFPAFVNMVAGLQQASRIERDLMTSYAATYWQTLRKLRLPAALPFLFAAFKINASLSLIGAIVAEFFGTPVHGIGFRISAEIGHLALDHVWAAILVAALVGSTQLRAARRGGTQRDVLASLATSCRAPKWPDKAENLKETHVLKTNRLRRLIRSGVAASLAAALAMTTTAAHALDATSIQLKWVYQAQFAGYIVAQNKGYYKAHGLEVTIKPGGPGPCPAAGDRRRRCRFRRRLAAQRPVGARKRRADGQHRAVLHPRGRADHLLERPGMTKPEEYFKGKTVGVAFGGNEYPFLAFASHLN